MKLIDGKQISKKILEKVQQKVESLSFTPKLGIIQLGDDEATNIYVGLKVKDAAKVGIEAEVFKFFELHEQQVEDLIHKLNQDKATHGFIIQFPFPLKGNITKLLSKIDAHKDVDGLNPYSLGLAWHKNTRPLYPATVDAILECMRYANSHGEIDLENEDLEFVRGKRICIINNSIIVGKPLAGILSSLDATITICNKFTPELSEFTKPADIIITATGKVGLLNSGMVKEDAVLIDVGIKRTPDGVKGDIDFDSLENSNYEGWITPVPGGVGPITRAKLLENVVREL